MNLRGFFPQFYNLHPPPPPPPPPFRPSKIYQKYKNICLWFDYFKMTMSFHCEASCVINTIHNFCKTLRKTLWCPRQETNCETQQHTKQIYTFSKHENWPHSINFRQPGFRDIFKKRLSIQKGYFVILKKNQRKLSAVNISLSKVVSFMLQL